MASRMSSSPELSVVDKLHDEIAKLRAQVESLKHDVQLQTATLMTSESTRQIIQSHASAPTVPAQQRKKLEKLATRFAEQTAHKQQCLYRACASITTFKVRDPDPRAVDAGNVLGLRFEVMAKASRFARPYYVLLNRPYADADRRRLLRVHRHTVPPCIPLAGLAARYLPLSPVAGAGARDVDDDDDGRSKKQDLAAFARALRRELVRYHNRAAVIADLRRAAGLGGAKKPVDRDREQEQEDAAIVDISAADAEAKQISMQWRDGRSGRLVMNDDGDIVKMVVQGSSGQDRETVREFLGGAVRIEEVSRRLDTR
ncbi:Cenp-O kinetochore centromere component-domain-containing protein [Nemania sp. FL0916]|nr:Cenp-O kinetochore centromere component-domain-containing protein [Nemania sp. FL0916]